MRGDVRGASCGRRNPWVAWPRPALWLVALVACGEATTSTQTSAADTVATDSGSAQLGDAQVQDCCADEDAATLDSGADDADDDTSPGDTIADGEAASDDAATSDGAATDGSAEDAANDTGSDAGAQDGGGDAADAADSGAPWVQPPIWNSKLIEDAADAKCAFEAPHSAFDDGVSLDAWKVTFISYESIDGELKPILIRAFAARPKGSNALPGVVQAHGLGGYAKESHATGLAALTGAFVIAYTGPGGGTEPDNTSEGLPSGANSGKRMFDVIPDTRGTWFWGHAMAARRALTCLANRPDVIPSKLGITGFSAGGVTSWLVGGNDARVSAAVPLSGVLAWDVATQSVNAWQHNLLKQAGLTTSSPEWTKLMAEIIAPSVALANAKGKVFLVNGSSDEFFPLTASNTTWTTWPGLRWMSIVGNFDHGVYQAYGAALPGGTAAIESAADLRARGAQRALFHHVFGTDSRYAELPAAPDASLQSVGAAVLVAAVPKPSPSALTLESMRVWFSLDNAKTWLYADLDKSAAGWTKALPGPAPANLVWYVDAVYKTKDLLPQRMSVSTTPSLPGGWVPDIWGMP